MAVRKAIYLWHKHREHREEVAKAKQIQSEGQVHLYNFWGITAEDFWLYRFVQAHNLLATTKKTIGFWSVFGDRRLVDDVADDINVFYSGENVHLEMHIQYADYMLSNPKIHLALGFDCFEHQKYQRLPLWIMYAFGDCYTFEDVCKRCDELRYPKIDDKKKWVSAVSSWDPSGIRAQIADVVGEVKKIDYPGKWRHNDDTLKNEFADDKIAYLKQYIFNICPENSNSYGYVTEKLFEAITAGCIPIYWGSYNDPELGIINKDVVLFYNEKDGGRALKKKMEQLIKDESYLNYFMGQPRLLQDAENKIWEMISGVKHRLEQIIGNG